MKLIELDPHWIAEEGRHGQGLFANCPIHGDGCHSGGIAIYFDNPIDGGEKWNMTPKNVFWHREGNTFEALTISPSIQSHDENGNHWHGFIRNGEIINA